MPKWKSWRKTPEADSDRNIVKLISELCGLPSEEVRPESRLVHDLGIGGDDAVELLTAFSREFQVDMDGFNFDEYFPGESMVFAGLMRHLGWKLGLRKDAPFGDLRAIRVADLQRIAKAGHWVQPE